MKFIVQKKLCDKTNTVIKSDRLLLKHKQQIERLYLIINYANHLKVNNLLNKVSYLL